MIKTTWLAWPVARPGSISGSSPDSSPCRGLSAASLAPQPRRSVLPIELAQGSMPRRLASRPGARRCCTKPHRCSTRHQRIRPLHDIRLMRQLVGPPCTASHRVPLEPRGRAPVSLQRHSRISERAQRRSAAHHRAQTRARSGRCSLPTDPHGADPGGRGKAQPGDAI